MRNDIESPLLEIGNLVLRLADDEMALATSPVGGCGAVDTVPVVADEVFDGLLVPMLLIADTR